MDYVLVSNCVDIAEFCVVGLHPDINFFDHMYTPNDYNDQNKYFWYLRY